MNRVISILFVGLLVISCVREEIIHIENIDRPRKLVILGYLTPADSIHIYVGEAIPFGQLHEGTATLAPKVKLLSHSGDSIVMMAHESNKSIYTCSQKDFKIEIGGKYSIEVNAEGFPTASASTTVPSQKAYWKTVTLSQMNDGSGEFVGTWDALPDENDVDYGVSIYHREEPRDILLGNQFIIPLKNEYRVQRRTYYGDKQLATLITSTKAMGNFSKMAELTIEMSMYYSESGFFDVLSGFKGIIPNSNNIHGGLGIFGSYLMHTSSVPL